MWIVFRFKIIIVLIIILRVKGRYIKGSISSKDLTNNFSGIVVIVSIGATKYKVSTDCSSSGRVMYLAKESK